MFQMMTSDMKTFLYYNLMSCVNDVIVFTDKIAAAVPPPNSYNNNFKCE
jgi:multimeric flavodoxin WrbA